MKGAPAPHHYSYRHYEKASTASTFDDRRFGGPIGNLVAGTQAQVLANFIGRINERRILDVGTGTGRAQRLTPPKRFSPSLARRPRPRASACSFNAATHTPSSFAIAALM